MAAKPCVAVAVQPVSKHTRTHLPLSGIGYCIVVCFSLACSLGTAVHGDEAPNGPAKRILLYTDNTPGAMVWSYAHAWSAYHANVDVQIVTSQSSFIDTLPAFAWDRVVVTERHAEASPAYASALAAYVESGGYAMIHRWREDATNPPEALQIVQAPVASHVWYAGQTIWAYYLTKLESEKASGVDAGYVMKSFSGVSTGATSIVSTIGMGQLVAGLHTAAQQNPPTDESCEGKMDECVIKAQDEHIARNADCRRAYGPRPLATPPSPGSPEKLKACLLNALQAMHGDIVKIVNDYFVCVDIRSLPSQ
ncbi:MAG: hypothetical protein KF841_12165 [Phycisphaerae bacterium]|nr:hypothetical protein [Phycisphaerae bacterium]